MDKGNKGREGGKETKGEKEKKDVGREGEWDK